MTTLFTQLDTAHEFVSVYFIESKTTDFEATQKSVLSALFHYQYVLQNYC